MNLIFYPALTLIFFRQTRMKSAYYKLFQRNIGALTFREQEKIRKARIAIAGTGGVGGLLAERMVRLGIGEVKISDPGLFEKSNFNRQLEADCTTIGKNKAKIIGKRLKQINKSLKLKIDSHGIHTQADANRLVTGTDIIIDEMDFGLFKQSIFLQRAARKQKSFYIFSSAIAFGAFVVCFEPNGCTLEEFNGLTPDCDLDETKQPAISANSMVPILPDYLLKKQNLLKKYMQGKLPVSTISIGVGLTSIVTANEAVNLLLYKSESIFAPNYLYIDLHVRDIKIGKIVPKVKVKAK